MSILSATAGQRSEASVTCEKDKKAVSDMLELELRNSPEYAQRWRARLEEWISSTNNLLPIVREECDLAREADKRTNSEVCVVAYNDYDRFCTYLYKKRVRDRPFAQPLVIVFFCPVESSGCVVVKAYPAVKGSWALDSLPEDCVKTIKSQFKKAEWTETLAKAGNLYAALCEAAEQTEKIPRTHIFDCTKLETFSTWNCFKFALEKEFAQVKQDLEAGKDTKPALKNFAHGIIRTIGRLGDLNLFLDERD